MSIVSIAVPDLRNAYGANSPPVGEADGRNAIAAP
jgi:hypothetical protein